MSNGGGKPKGYNFSVHVTKGHEREAMEAQRRKKPNRIGKLVLNCWASEGRLAPTTSSSR